MKMKVIAIVLALITLGLSVLFISEIVDNRSKITELQKQILVEKFTSSFYQAALAECRTKKERSSQDRVGEEFNRTLALSLLFLIKDK